jgi:hypothetical protein
VGGGVVAFPQLPQRRLTADVPELEIYGGVLERDYGDVLADGGDGGAAFGRWRCVGKVQ